MNAWIQKKNYFNKSQTLVIPRYSFLLVQFSPNDTSYAVNIPFYISTTIPLKNDYQLILQYRIRFVLINKHTLVQVKGQ